MNSSHNDPIIIIGAGLTGLTLGYYLEKQNKDFIIIESRSRIGGRVLTEIGKEGIPIELGATWLGQQHENLLKLLEELKIEIFRQELGATAIVEPISTSPPYLASLPPNHSPSFRIKGGTHTITNVLKSAISQSRIKLSEKVESISLDGDKLSVLTDKSAYQGSKIISTLPPNLLTNTIDFYPKLPKELISIAENTHTWMSQSIKVALSFNSPFWRKRGKSATVMSNVGPIPEMYEHNNAEDTKYALMGFMDGNYYSLKREERLKKVLTQLSRYYGDEVKNHIQYHEKTWATDPNTHHPYNRHILPHQNNGHRLYQQSYFNGRLIISGTETSTVYPGYLDGAVNSALQALAQLQKTS